MGVYTDSGLQSFLIIRYNWPAKKLFKRLLQLGAQSILPRGDGDDQHYLGFRVEFVGQKFEENKEKINNGEIYALLVNNKRVTSHDHFQDVRHIELDIGDTEHKYNPGDVAVIRPKNLPEDVDEFIKLMNLSDVADDTFILVPNDEGCSINLDISIRL
ncbi:7172_t:CDS:2 [Racocetra fulgida]|uniref:7172_t:CDS:1 n=1 Tax=Racocetra fulgida TaxID=60492 RepID=A0A9N9B733_9GLOM|nr:7172_t:CDS:2 [Racocetra fulgida]